jgi:hypothetical protein
MRVRLDRYQARNSQMQMRTLLAFVFGIAIFVFGAFGGFIGIMMLLMPEAKDIADGGQIWARRSGFFLGFFVGVVPCAIGSLMMWNAARQRGRFKRLGELAAVARQSPDLTTAHVSHALALAPLEAEKLVVEASTLGIIEDGPPLHRSNPPPPLALAVTVGSQSRVPVAPPSIKPGIVLAHTYRIEEPLGRGGMGEVFAARHLRTGRRYAVKTILAGPNADEGMIRRFEREATAASALGHPNIVQVHDFNAEPGGLFYLVMDLLEGETLGARLDRGGPLAWPEAQRIALELASALAAAHAQGLLHRDIKPSNVFLARTSGAPERSVLVDFGLVKPISETATHLTHTGAVVGTPMYMSPEQARGEALDIRSDLYSLAAVVFESITGAPPFQDRTLASVYARLLAEPAPLASSIAKGAIPRGVDDVLARALSKDKAARFPDCKAFADALSKIAEDAPSTERMTEQTARIVS